MAEFAYNNTKNASTGHTPFELNCGYYPRISFEDKCNIRYRSSLANRLAVELRKLINVCCQNMLHTQDLQKQANDKGVKPCSYAPDKKIWLNSRHIKTKRNRKLKAKIFGPFQVLHPVGKQVYKLELPANWKIYDLFHVSLPEQDTTKKRQMNKFAKVPEFELGDDKKYKVEVI